MAQETIAVNTARRIRDRLKNNVVQVQQSLQAAETVFLRTQPTYKIGVKMTALSLRQTATR